MKKIINKIGKKSLNTVFQLGKRALKGSPGLKVKLKNRVLANINLTPQSTTNQQSEWLKRHIPDGIFLQNQREEADNLPYRPLVSIIVPTYNTPSRFFKDMIDSVLSQTYDNWELVLVDDASPDDSVRELIKQCSEKESRIVYKFLKTNHHIAGATNEGIKIAKGEFISLFDHDDILWPNALFEVVKSLNDNKKLNFIYTDEDKIRGNDRFDHFDLFFKPDWNPDFLRSVNYITHFTTIRKTILDKYGYEDGKYNGAQDWELFLRITRNIDSATIHHIPTILYSWRVHDNSTAKNIDAKPYVVGAQKQALLDDIIARKVKAKLLYEKALTKWSIMYELVGDPLISIIIPSKNNLPMIKRCIESILSTTKYKNYEIIIVDTGSTNRNVIRWYKSIERKYPNIIVKPFIEKKFSFSRSCNYGASLARGELLLMLNDDTEILDGDWLSEMGGYAQQKHVGVVGIKLYYPGQDKIQHAGIGVGFAGTAANLFIGFDVLTGKSLLQHLMLEYVRDVTAVTAACAMIRTELFNEVGGFADKYRINYNDVDLCLRIREKGYQNVYLPDVEVVHYESASRGLPNTKKHDNLEFKNAQKMFKKEWVSYINHDPALNPNLSRGSSIMDISTQA